MTTSHLAIHQYFWNLRDPRRDHLKQHLLIDIVTIAICAVMSGADTWIDIETFAVHRQDWLAKFLKLPNGIPSHDTIERVFSLINPRSFQRCVMAWLRPVAEALDIKHIAIDGKTLRHSAKPSSPHHYLHLVSAWATEARLTLGQVAVEEKSNEITAIPKLLEMMSVRGALVTIDAMGCQKEIAAKIVEKKGDYVLIVKENQEHLYEDILKCLTTAYDAGGTGFRLDEYTTEESAHGREEKRTYTILTDPEGIRPWLGALLLAYYALHGRLVYAGRVGAGIDHAELGRLWRRLQPLATSKMPLDQVPPRSNRFGSPLVLRRVFMSKRCSWANAVIDEITRFFRRSRSEVLDKIAEIGRACKPREAPVHPM